jgi:hypothetical protein
VVTDGSELPWDPVEAAGLGLVVDAATAEAVAAFRAAGISSILLKGASFDAWLYEPEEPRAYGDVDLLVSGDDVERAGDVLRRLGYRRRAGREPARTVEHAQVWVRSPDDMCVDLHVTLGGADRADVDPWAVLSADTDRILVADTEVDILSEPARALHIALHAAVSEAAAQKPLIDLSRALPRLPPETWTRAAGLAKQLGAEAAFAAGLRRLPDGEELAGRLGLTDASSVDAALLAESAPYSAWTIDRLANARGPRAKLDILLPRLLPRPEFMRVWYPVARRGPLGLALAYLRRVAWLVGTTPRALRAWLRARRRSD